jgi:hypothetical protein
MIKNSINFILELDSCANESEEKKYSTVVVK